jgi:hypothetical protein
MGTLIMAVAIGFSHLSSRATRPSRERELDHSPSAGLAERVELLRLWLPESLMELAGRQPDSAVVHTHQELRSLLERLGQESVWYALTFRCHQVDCNVSDVTFIRQPYNDPQYFPEFLAVLATAAGNPPRHLGADFSKVNVYLIPGELLKGQPREAMEVLISAGTVRPPPS